MTARIAANERTAPPSTGSLRRRIRSDIQPINGAPTPVPIRIIDVPAAAVGRDKPWAVIKYGTPPQSGEHQERHGDRRHHQAGRPDLGNPRDLGDAKPNAG